jgi:DNA-binding MarR family transcriptional regulator
VYVRAEGRRGGEVAEAARPGETRPPFSPLMVMILHGRNLEGRLQERLREHGLSMRRLGLLGHLQASPGISFSGLARRAGIRVQSLQPVMAEMLEAGLVRAIGGVDQGRAAAVELTDSGRTALLTARGVIAALEQEVFVGGAWSSLASALAQVSEEEFARVRATREDTP